MALWTPCPDHPPHRKEKADFRKAPNGSIGMETSTATTALEGVLTLPQILEKMSTAPARILGIPAGTAGGRQRRRGPL
ncbi:MAG: hypothetical protein ACLRSY_05875 [Acutalibacter sp.]